MNTTKRIPVTCPNCETSLTLAAHRVRPGAWFPCPDCCAPVRIDAADPDMADALAAAAAARDERRRYRQSLQRDWRLSPPALFAAAQAEAAPSADVETLLDGLDSLLGRLDALMVRQRGTA
jgi:hypothetical protein